jgi:tetratricopeptide (TPR) repeat protein
MSSSVPSQPAAKNTANTALLLAIACLIVGIVAWTIWPWLRPSQPTPVNVADAKAAGQSTAPANTPPVRSAAEVTAAVDAVLNAAITLTREDKVAQAETMLREATNTYPTEARVWAQLGEVLTAQRKLDEAATAYETAVSHAGNDTQIVLAAAALMNAANKPERAAELYALAVKLSPNDAKPPLFLSQIELKLGRTTEAKKNLLLAAQLDPTIAVAWGSLADIALRENALEIALQHIAKARALVPENTVYRLIEARILKRKNQPREALQLLTGLTPEQRREPGVLPLMTECLGMLGKPGDAAALYKEAIDADPSNTKLLIEGVAWRERAGDKAGAIEWAERAKLLSAPNAAELVERLKK